MNIVQFSELKTLPRNTLERIALTVAADIDRGEDKRDLLERLMRLVAAHSTMAAFGVRFS